MELFNEKSQKRLFNPAGQLDDSDMVINMSRGMFSFQAIESNSDSLEAF